ncbi:hypothetical protein NIES208_16345 (plasmid) [[Limnothrix rosea] IAM M-220]|nr:hypothetical protein NIES208_16345 [[Limnothrix rosea] IAM M-220]
MDKELKQKLKAIADKDQRSVSQMAAILLDEAIKKREKN